MKNSLRYITVIFIAVVVMCAAGAGSVFAAGTASDAASGTPAAMAAGAAYDAASGTPAARAAGAANGHLLSDSDAFAFRGGAVLQELREDAKTYPAAFDLRHVDVDGDGKEDKNFVTPVRLQNPFGTCWGFGAVAAAESSLIADGLADESVDLSEKHLSWFVTSYIDDPKSPQNGEGCYFNGITEKDKETSAYRYNTGGFVSFVTSVFSSGMGPVAENATDPETGESLADYLEYRGKRGETTVRSTAVEYDEDNKPVKWARRAVWNSDEDDWSIPEKYRYLQSYRLKDSIILPHLWSKQVAEDEYDFSEDALDSWKQQMYEGHRALSIDFCAETFLPGQDTSGKQYMSEHWAHYVPKSEFSNHVVAIVGWDDNYPKENFLTPPPGDGAFLIKNSWGSELNDFPNNGYRHWGLLEGQDGVPYDPDARPTSTKATGYFWISYYDRSFTNAEALVFDGAEPGSAYDIAQYDFTQMSEIGSLEKSDDNRSANVFTAEKTSELKEISVMTTVPGTEVTYEVYMLPEGFDDPEDGLKIAEGKETFRYGGHHRVTVDSSRVLAKGQLYSVVVREYAEGDPIYGSGNYDGTYMPVKYYYGDETEPDYQKVIVNEGESFVHMKGKWQDVSDPGVQAEMADSNESIKFDNFPIKAYLKPAWDSYLTVSNWQDGNPGAFTLLSTGESKTLTAEFRSPGKTFPDDWNPKIKWTSSDSSVVSVTPKENDYGDAVISPVGAGKAYIMVDAGEYGTRIIGIVVVKPGIASFDVDDSEAATVYTGKPIKPVLSNFNVDSPDGGYEEADLKEGVDYIVSYQDNINAGDEAAVIVTGIGEYGGGMREYFTIHKAANTMKASGKTVKLKASSLKKKKATVKAAKAYSVKDAVGKVTYKKVSGKKNFTVASNGKITVKKGTKKGKYKLTVNVTAAGDTNHKAAEKKVKVTIKVS